MDLPGPIASAALVKFKLTQFQEADDLYAAALQAFASNH